MVEKSDFQADIEQTEHDILGLQEKRRLLRKDFLNQTCVKDLERVLKIADNFSYLWDDGAPLYGEKLSFTGYWVAQDEYWGMDVQRKEGKFSFTSRSNFQYMDVSFFAEEAARVLVSNGYKGTTGKLVQNFKNVLEEPLGKYLAKKELDDLQI